MKAVIPAAGIGERLRPLTLTRPKVLLPVAGKPILGHILDRIVESGIKDVTIVVGYMGNQVIKYVRNHYNLNFDFVEQKKRRGLGHAVLQGLDSSDEPVLILLGDTILDLNFYKFAQSRYNVIGVMTVEDPRRFGIVEVKDEWVTKLVEKPENPHRRPPRHAAMEDHDHGHRRGDDQGFHHLLQPDVDHLRCRGDGAVLVDHDR